MSNFVISSVLNTPSFVSKLGKVSLDRVSLVAKSALEQFCKALVCAYKILIAPIVFIKNVLIIFMKHLALLLSYQGSISYIFNLLQKEKILTKELETLISFLVKNRLDQYPAPGSRLRSDIDKMVGILKQSHILTSENLHNFLKVVNRSELIKACSCFAKVGLLNQELFSKIWKYFIFNQNKNIVVRYWEQISEHNVLEYVLNQEIIGPCFDCDGEKLDAYYIRLIALTRAAAVLKKSGILSSENIAVMRNHGSLVDLKFILEILSSINILTQASFDDLIANPILISNESWRSFWLRVPEYLLTQDVLDHLIVLAQGQNPYITIQQYANQLIDRVGVINRAQSTHAATIHKLLSESEKKLKGT